MRRVDAPEVLPTPAAGLADRQRVFIFLALYFLLHLTLRVLVSPGAELDEAEQLVLTQDLRWGYASQPPLYTWLQFALFEICGPGVLGLALLKNFLLFLLYLFTFLAGREAAGEDGPALAGAASLLFLPQIAWESQRDLTHSVLATACAAATLYALIRLLRRGATRDALLFGLCAGLGMLAKYNFAVFLAALLLASLSSRELRARLRPRHLIAFLPLLLVTGGHLTWVLAHPDAAASQAGTLHMGTDRWRDYATGLASLARGSISFLAPAAIVFVLLLVRTPAAAPPSPEPWRRLLARTLLIGIALCLLLVLGFRVTNFKDRWMQPLLFFAPLWAVLAWRARFSPARLQKLFLLAGLAAAAVLVVLPARTLLAERIGRGGRLNAPFEQLSTQIREAGFSGGNIAAGNRWVGGNLRLEFPGSAVSVPELPTFRMQPEAPWLLAWDATRGEEMPADLHRLCAMLPGCRPDGLPVYVSAPIRYGQRPMRLGILLPAQSP